MTQQNDSLFCLCFRDYINTSAIDRVHILNRRRYGIDHDDAPHHAQIKLLLSTVVLSVVLSCVYAASGEAHCVDVPAEQQSTYCGAVARVCSSTAVPPDLRYYNDLTYSNMKKQFYDDCRCVYISVDVNM